MDRLRKSFRSSFRRKSQQDDIDVRTVTWPKDEAAVKTNTCSFDVKYLGAVEVFESRGMQVCEEALKLLKNSKRRPIRGTLHVSGDGLRVVDKDTKGLVLDQTIEKVSFCAPDRSYEKGFSYICRDGTTRRWMCHGFLSVGDSGERLSHAVGCAFAICLEKKQLREKESVQYHYNKKDNVFTRFGSFQQGSIHDRLKDPQEFKPGLEAPKPLEPVSNPHAVARPRASDMYLRQASMRGIGRMPANSLFKRQYSLRLDQLPSTLHRQKSGCLTSDDQESSNGNSCTTIQEDGSSPSKECSTSSFSSSVTSPAHHHQGGTPDPLMSPSSGLPMSPPCSSSGAFSAASTSRRSGRPLSPPAANVARLSEQPPLHLAAARGGDPLSPPPLSSAVTCGGGPMSLPAAAMSASTPVSVLTDDDIPLELPPPMLSPTPGCILSPPASAASVVSPVLGGNVSAAGSCVSGENSRASSAETKRRSVTASPSDVVVTPAAFAAGLSLSGSEATAVTAANNNNSRSFNPFTAQGGKQRGGKASQLPPTKGGVLMVPTLRSLPPLVSRVPEEGPALPMPLTAESDTASNLGSDWSLEPRRGAAHIRPLEGFNPWDNVPDQPIVRTGVQKTVRPVSMIEAESLSKAQASVHCPALERGCSLETSINNTANEDEKYNQLFTGAGDSEAGGSGFLRDPFDSDWAEMALRTKGSTNHYQRKGERAFKTFELQF